MTVWRCWIGVHRWRPAGVLLALSGLAALLTRTVAVDRVGVQQLVSPVALALLIPVIAATAVVIGCVGPGLYLPDPRRAKVARLLWLLALTGLALVVCVAGSVGTGLDQATPAAVVRNVLLFVSLAMLALAAGYPAFGWLPPTGYVLLAMQFGATSGSGHSTWAVVLDNQGGPAAILVSAGAYGSAALLYALHRRRGSRD